MKHGNTNIKKRVEKVHRHLNHKKRDSTEFAYRNAGNYIRTLGNGIKKWWKSVA